MSLRALGRQFIQHLTDVDESPITPGTEKYPQGRLFLGGRFTPPSPGEPPVMPPSSPWKQGVLFREP